MNDLNQYKSNGKDKRCFRRFGVELAATVCRLQPEANTASNETYKAVVKDISLSGLSFISKKSFDIGTTIIISMLIHQVPVTVVGVTRRCNKDRIVLDQYNMGIQYIKEARSLAAIPLIGKYIQEHSLQVMKR